MKTSIADRQRKATPETCPETRPVVAIGIDLGDRFSEVCVLDEQGTVASQTRLRTTKAALQEYFSSRAPARVALETGTHSGWTSRLIAACGHEVIVANARELRRIYRSDRKNDRADAEILRPRMCKTGNARIRKALYMPAMVAHRCNPILRIFAERLSAQAAAIYWSAWSNAPIRLRRRDLARVPARWTRFDSRASVLTGAPRAATNPVNALINYCGALLESECRLALLAAGLDPTLGVMHADQRNRDSFALDVMEPVRPAVEAFILDLLEERVLTSRDFVELPNGVCRVRAPLTHDLAITLPRWRQLVAPVVADLAQRFRAALPSLRETYVRPRRDKRDGPQILTEVSRTPEIPRTNGRSHTGKASPRLTSAPSPICETPRKQGEKRPYASKAWRTPQPEAWRTPQPEALRLVPIPCAACGEPVVKRRRRHCDACIPGMKVTQANKAVVAARKALALQAADGNDPRRDPGMNRRRAVAISEGHRRNREWKREHYTQPRDDAWFRREVLPKLDAYPLNAIAEATGLSLTACSRIRAGLRTPHPRHWDALVALLRGKRLSNASGEASPIR